MPDDLRIEIPTTPDEIRQILDLLQNFSMKEPYEKFWDSITQDRENWDCENVDTLPCIHVEMDLLERFTRIGARPAIQLKEDIASRGVWRGALLKDTSLYERIPSMQNSDVSDLVFPPCPREDWVCQLLNPEKTHPRSGWRIEGADPQAHMDALNALRERMIDETIPKNNEGAFPYIVRPNDMLPSFEIPPPLTLTPLLISPAQ
jgi:hypothetical protein